MPAASKLKVLVVDDQLTIRSLVRTGLQQIGFSMISEAIDGEDALRSAITTPVDLIISDFNMPKLDGMGFLQAVRAHPPTKSTVFIMLTGRGDRELIEKAAKCGVNNYLVKPFSMPALKGAIEAVLGKLR